MEVIKFDTPESNYEQSVVIKVEDIKRFGLYWKKAYWKGNGMFRKFVRFAFIISDKRYEIPTDTAIKLKKEFSGKLTLRKEEITQWKKGKRQVKFNYYFEVNTNPC